MEPTKQDPGGSKQPLGFAGLVALATDVVGEVAEVNARAAGAAPPAAQERPVAPAGPVKVRQKGRTPDVVRGIAVLLGVAIGLVVLGYVFKHNSSPTRSTGSYSPTYTPPAAPSPSTSSGARASTPIPTLDLPIESKPAVGSGQSLSQNELRWCRYQKQRIDGARSAVQGSNDAAVRRFNDLVEDYNSRCGQYRYFKSDLDKVDAEVAGKTSSLRSEGAALVAPPRPPPKKTSTKPGASSGAGPSRAPSTPETSKPAASYGQGSGVTFACKDAEGNWIFGAGDRSRCVGSVRQLGGGAKSAMATQGESPSTASELKAIRLAPASYREPIRRAAEKYMLSSEILYAVIAVESGFDPRAQSRDGKIGLMQLRPAIAREMFVRDIWSPEENIEGGARYLRTLANEFDGDLTRTLAAYHSSPEAVQRAGGVPADKGTQDYVRKVLALYTQLRGNKAKG